jgi:hypothetical protein
VLVTAALCMAAAAGCYEDSSNRDADADAQADPLPDPDGIDVSTDDAAVDDADVSGDPNEEETVVDFSACTVPSECVFAIIDCCGPCGVPSLSDYDAINAEFLDEHHAAVCTDPDPICPGCAVMPNPELITTCDATGHCLGLDTGAEDLSLCSVDEDCRIRARDCCECGASMSYDNLIAIRTDAGAEYSDLVCDPDMGCPECAPEYPGDVQAICDEDGHCTAWVIPTP